MSELATTTLWDRCLIELAKEIQPSEYKTWIAQLKAEETDGQIKIVAHNKFIIRWVKNNYLSLIHNIAAKISGSEVDILLGMDDGSPAISNKPPKQDTSTPKQQQQPTNTTTKHEKKNQHT